MNWANAEAFWYILPWVLILPSYLWLERRAKRIFSSVIDLSNQSSKIFTADPSKARFKKFFILWIGAFFIILAAARPQSGVREEELKFQGLDIVFTLDLSASMATEDVVPSRLKKAKHIIKSFLDNFSGDRAGILGFANSALPLVPLTTDYDYVKQVLDGLDETTIAFQGSNVYGAIDAALNMIERAGVDGGSNESEVQSRAIILISDGEDHEGASSALVEKAKKLGTKIYSIGVGTSKGGPVPIRDERGQLKEYKKDSSGTAVVSKLIPDVLRKIATSTGGAYYEATFAEDEVKSIVNELLSLDRTGGASRRVTVYEEIFQYPLILGILIILIGLFLGEASKELRSTKFFSAKKNLTTIIILYSFINFNAFVSVAAEERAESWEEYSETKRGIDAYKEDDLSSAVNHFGRAQAERPSDYKHHFNLGTALLKSGASKDAITSLTEASKSEEQILAGQSSFHLGKALQKESQPDKALDAYQHGLNKIQELKKSGQYNDQAKELETRLRQALMSAESQSQQQKQQSSEEKSQGGGGQGNGKDDKDKKSDKDSSGKDKDSEEDGKDKENKKYDIPKEKQKYKAENLTEGDAKRLMQQLKEQENQTAQKLSRKRSKEQKNKENLKDAGGKDW